MTGRTKLPNPRRNGEPITLDWIRSNCRVEVTAVPMTECWTWLGAKVSPAMVAFRFAGEAQSAIPRMAYAISSLGPSPDGWSGSHVWEPSCCNPDHLSAATSRENIHWGDLPSNRARIDAGGGNRTVMSGPPHVRRRCGVGLQG